VRALTSAALVALTLLLMAPGVARAGTDPTTPRCERRDEGDGDRPRRCVGPVTDESGGGGGTLTIVISVVVGLAVAGVAFVLVRKQLAKGAQPR
jgi:hypothetical protein